MEKNLVDIKTVLRSTKPIQIEFNHFMERIGQYVVNTEQKIANVMHLLPNRISGKVHVDVQKLHTLATLFPEKEAFLEVYVMDQVGILVEDQSHHIFLPHKSSF